MKKNKRGFLWIIYIESIKYTVYWEANKCLVWQDISDFSGTWKFVVIFAKFCNAAVTFWYKSFRNRTPNLCALNFMLSSHILRFLPPCLFPWSPPNRLAYPPCSNWRDKPNTYYLKGRPSHVDVFQHINAFHISLVIRRYTINVLGIASLKIKTL
jgi:hypothetical protein